MNNEIIKEGCWVEYVGRPNEKFLVGFSYVSNKEFRICHEDGLLIEFDKHGKIYPNDTHPIVKKTTPPKKKVLKEFEINLFINNYSKNISFYDDYIFRMFPTGNKARLIIEVEE